MDKLTFVSNLISSLVWPLIVILIVILLRKPLRELIHDLGRRLRSIKFPGGVAEFSQELAEIKEAADVANLPPVAGVPTGESLLLRIEEDIDQWARLVELSPRAAISEAWRWVENAMRETAKKLGITQPAISQYLAGLRGKKKPDKKPALKAPRKKAPGGKKTSTGKRTTSGGKKKSSTKK